MSSGNKPSWGSFLQQAVAGVEARLDNILAEEDEQSQSQSKSQLQPQPQPQSQKTSPGVSRTASTSSRANDRLKQRLQRVVAAKATPKTSPAPSPRQSLDLSRQSSDCPRQLIDRSRQSVDRPRPSRDENREEVNKKDKQDENGKDSGKSPGAGIRAKDEVNDGVVEEREQDPIGDTEQQPKIARETDSSILDLPSIQVPGGTEVTSVMHEDPDVKPDVKPNANPGNRSDVKPRSDTDKVVVALMGELDRLKSALQAKERQVTNLETRLQKTICSLEAASKKAVAVATTEKDRKKMVDLEDTIASLQVEKRLESDRAKAQIADLKDQADRAIKHAHKVETESKAELIALESRLEAVRARAEEVTTGPHADSEARLLRQLQNLQTQHTSASANWQGIETTLLSRISGLEGERDEALRRESDMRKKARDAATRAKRQKEELEEARSNTPNVDHINREHKARVKELVNRAKKAEAALEEAKAEMERQKQAAREEKRERSDNDRRVWPDDFPQAFRPGTGSRPESPQLPVPIRTFSADHLGPPPLPVKSRKLSSPSSNGEPSPVTPGQPPPRRPSALSYIQSMVSSASGGGGGQIASPVYGSTFGDVETPPVPPEDKDEMSDPMESIQSPAHAFQEVTSISTIAAGPSVQLVERMSAAIRRLESEKVAAKEELLRISNQRDDARNEIVALMKEMEGNKAAVAKVAHLEAEVEDINQRYQTTLELLGEKSELVDELKADVEDVKQMYRDLVERTVR